MMNKNQINTWRIMAFVCTLIMTIGLTGCSGKAGKSYDMGMDYYEEGQYTEAAESFVAAIEANPDKAEYYIAYGMTLIELGQYEDARKQFGLVVRDMDNRIVRENNKRAYRGMAIAFFNEGNFEQAKGYFEIALKTEELEELNEDLTSYMANCEMKLTNYKSALEYWNKLLEDGDDSADVMSEYYLGRGETQYAMDNITGAIEDFRLAVKENENNYQAYIGLYLTLKESQDESGSLEVLDTALSEIGDDKENVFYRAIFNYYKGDLDVANKEFSKALKSGNNNALYYLGKICQDKGDFEGAIEKYNEYTEQNPAGKNAEYCNQMGGCLLELQRYEEAITWLDKGVAMAAGKIRQQLLFNRVVAYEHIGDYNTAKELASAYLDIYTDENMSKEYEYIKTRTEN